MAQHTLTGAPEAPQGACPVRGGRGGNHHPDSARRPPATPYTFSTVLRVVAAVEALTLWPPAPTVYAWGRRDGISPTELRRVVDEARLFAIIEAKRYG
jgi:hypothetical protein